MLNSRLASVGGLSFDLEKFFRLPIRFSIAGSRSSISFRILAILSSRDPRLGIGRKGEGGSIGLRGS